MMRNEGLLWMWMFFIACEGVPFQFSDKSFLWLLRDIGRKISQPAREHAREVAS